LVVRGPIKEEKVLVVFLLERGVQGHQSNGSFCSGHKRNTRKQSKRYKLQSVFVHQY
jgi:hypothetical protein